MKDLECASCGATLDQGDAYCPECGDATGRDPNVESIVADPVIAPMVASPSPRPIARRRRLVVVVSLAMLLLVTITVSLVIVYINERFETINSLSTPPSVITGDQLGGNQDIVIDTGPAQEAVRQNRERAQTAQSATDEPGAFTDAYARNGGMLLAFQPQGEPETGPSTPAASPVAASPVAESATPSSIQLPPTDTRSTINVLLMGVDARPGEAIDIGVRSDTLVVLNLDPETGSCRLLAIPRDSYVDLPGYGNSKVNHALAIGGVPYQMLVVENLLGIPLDHYGLIDFSGVEDLVNALGGVTVLNDSAFTFNGHDFPVGEVELNGEEALAYVRFRGDAEGDFGRQERQQLVVRGLLAAGADLDVVTALPELFDAVEDHVRTDASLTRLVDLAREFHSTCTAQSLDAKRINGEVATLYDVVLDQPLSFVILAEQEVEEKVNWLLTGEEPPTVTPITTPVASPVTATPVTSPAPGSPEATPAASRRLATVTRQRGRVGMKR